MSATRSGGDGDLQHYLPLVAIDAYGEALKIRKSSLGVTTLMSCWLCALRECA